MPSGKPILGGVFQRTYYPLREKTRVSTKRPATSSSDKVREFVVGVLDTEIDGKPVRNHIQEFVSKARTDGETIHNIWLRGASKTSDQLSIDMAMDRKQLKQTLLTELGDSVGESGTLLSELVRSVLFGTSKEGRKESVMTLRDSLER